MMYTRKSQPIAFILVLALVLTLFAPTAYADEPDYGVRGILTKETIEVTQGGVPIDEIISPNALSTSPIAIKISFNVPVLGDNIVNEPPDKPVVKHGDVAFFKLSNAFTIPPSGVPIRLMYGGIQAGEVTFEKIADVMWAKVTFNGEEKIFNGIPESESAEPIHGVSCEFEASLKFDSTFAGGEWGEQKVVILNKEYTVNVPAPEIKYTMKKAGLADLSKQEILWTVTVSGIQGKKGVDLRGYEFFDDLKKVGEYVTNSFQVNGNTASPQISDGAIRYIFQDGDSTTPQAIVTFKTKIPEGNYIANSQQTIMNTAKLSQGGIEMAKAPGEAKFTPKWIEKSGEASGENIAVYDPTNRTITWTITANHFGAPLKNVVITDVMPKDLTVSSAAWQAWNSGTSTWGAITNIPTSSNTSQFAIGTDTINSKILLTIVAKVPDQAYTTGSTIYSNSASIHWEGLTGPGLGTGFVDVGIGYNAITKSGEADPKEGNVHWTVGVNAKSQNIPDMKVYDLLVYTSGSGVFSPDGWPSGIDNNITSKLKPQYNQKYIDNSFTGSGLELKVYPVTQGGVRVGDLLEVTGFTTDKAMTFEFDSLVLNPDIFAGNKTQNVLNTASLFSANEWLNQATASVGYDSRVLEKEILERGNVNDPASAVNSGKTTTAAVGFDYIDKSVIFRLSVNANGRDLTGATNAAMKVLGDVIVTDTLPEGWVFTDITEGTPYLIFEGNTGSSTSVTAKDTTPDTVTGLDANFSSTGMAIFTFENLDRPYVILIKAKPTDDKNLEYFNDNKTTSEENVLTLKTEEWTPGVTVKQGVSIASNILTKSHEQPRAGELKWTVEYKPYELDLKGTELKDTLPPGIDLRIASTGALLIEGNITAQALSLNSDGSYTVATPVALELGKNIFYDNEHRILEFKIEDSKTAYRFEYMTDITGEPGTITNEVLLYGVSTGAIETAKPYTIQSADGSATMQRSGWIGITKKGNGGVNLSGAAFTVFTKDGTTIIRTGETASDGALKLRGIPVGNYIIQETKAPEDYTLQTMSYSLSVTADPTITVSIDGKTGSGSNQMVVNNFKSSTHGDLVINKTVTGNAGDREKLFTFTVNFSDSGEYEYWKSNGEKGSVSSGGIISLSHGQQATIIGIPIGTTYSAVENNYTSEGYRLTKTGDEGTIAAGTQTASFTNHKSSGGGGGGTPTDPTTPGGITTEPGITTPEAVKGSVRITKVDGEDTSQTLSGAVFEILDASGRVVATPVSGSNGVITFSNLDMGAKYFLREKTAPAGYVSSGEIYSFTLYNTTGQKDVAVEYRNYREETELLPIDPGDIPAGWTLEEESFPGSGLDETPKTGEERGFFGFLAVPLIMISGAGLLHNRKNITRRKLAAVKK